MPTDTSRAFIDQSRTLLTDSYLRASSGRLTACRLRASGGEPIPNRTADSLNCKSRPRSVAHLVSKESSMRRLIAVGFLAAFSCLPACGHENRSVTAPSATAPAPSPVPPNPRPGPSTAVLAVSTFTATLVPPALTRISFGYDVKLELAETSGRSGATLTKITLIFPNGDTDNTGPGCWGKPVRINPGSTWEMAGL